MYSTRYTDATVLPLHALHCASSWSSLLTVRPVMMLMSTTCCLLLHQPAASVSLSMQCGKVTVSDFNQNTLWGISDQSVL